MDKDALATSRFSCSERDRAVFEAGIKMATIYHQFVGTPYDRNSVTELEKTMSHTIEVQPYVKSAKVTLDKSMFRGDRETYSYVSLTGTMIDAVVTVELGKTEVTAEMRYDPELDYPLMYISKIETKD